MKTQLMISILLLFTIIGCKKDNTTTVEGTIVNSGTKEPLDSVMVVLQDGIAAGGALGGGNTVGNGSRVTTYTKANGYFKISIQSESPFLGIKKDRYSTDIGMESFKSGGNYSVRLEMDAEAYFQPILKSKDGGTTDDIVKFLDGYTYPIWADFEQYGSSTSEKFYGKGPFSLYHTSSPNAKGDIYRTFKIGLWRNNDVIIKIDSVYIKSFTTFKDTIYY
jgi:hypothetical protein